MEVPAVSSVWWRERTDLPPDESLVQNTLWPEEHKLYGHGYELFCVAASPDSGLVASTCKSTDAASSRGLSVVVTGSEVLLICFTV